MPTTPSPKPQLSLVYQDDNIIAVNKPSGLLSVPGLSEPDNLLDQVQSHFPNARVVHRLDMPTSGIILFALNYESQRGLSRLFEQRKIQKRYVAIVDGRLSSQYGEVHSPLICDWPKRPKQKIDWLEGKASSTYFSVLTSDAGSSRVDLKPITGRTHQLRVHMLQIGHPILGDAFYNKNNSENRASRLLLHAEEISFVHPISRRDILSLIHISEPTRPY